jgi:2-methylcitrate dehydratase PrpD
MPTPSPIAADEDPPEARDVTRKLAQYVVATRFEDLPEGVRREVGRSLLNWMGVAIGASRHEAVEIALAAVMPFSGPPQAGSSVARSAST